MITPTTIISDVPANDNDALNRPETSIGTRQAIISPIALAAEDVAELEKVADSLNLNVIRFWEKEMK